MDLRGRLADGPQGRRIGKLQAALAILEKNRVRTVVRNGRRRASLRSRTASSARLRSAMSRTIFEAPMIRPSWPLTGETVTETSSRFPSLVTRTVSRRSTRWPLQQSLQDLLFLLNPLRRQQHRDRLADDLLLAVAE